MKGIKDSELKAQPEKENFSGKYEESNPISKYLVKNYFRAVKDLIRFTKDVNFCHEIGIGEGWSTKILKEFVPNLSASEFVSSLIPAAKTKNPDIVIFQESAYDLKYNNEQVDLVFLLEVLEHLDHPEVALEEISRISNKYLILGVPNEPLWRILNLCRLKYIRELGNTPGHLNHWSKRGIIEIVEKKFGKVINVKAPIPWTILLAEKNV